MLAPRSELVGTRRVSRHVSERLLPKGEGVELVSLAVEITLESNRIDAKCNISTRCPVADYGSYSCF